MDMANFIQKLRKINSLYSIPLWNVNIGGVEMALFFLFALGEIFVSKFIPMEPDTQHLVSEAMSCISVLILGEAILRSLSKLTSRRRWGFLTVMAGGGAAGLIIRVLLDLFDNEVAVDADDLIALGVLLGLFLVAGTIWWRNISRLKQIKLERNLTRKKRNNI